MLGITSDVSVAVARPVSADRTRSAGAVPAADQMEHGVDRADQIPQALRTAFRATTTGRPGAAHLCLPYDVQKQLVDAPRSGRSRHAAFPAWRTAPIRWRWRRPTAAIRRRGGRSSSAAAAWSSRGARGARAAGDAAGCAGLHDGQRQGQPRRRPIRSAPAWSAEWRRRRHARGGAAADLVFFIGCRAGSTTTERWRPRRGRPNRPHRCRPDGRGRTTGPRPRWSAMPGCAGACSRRCGAVGRPGAGAHDGAATAALRAPGSPRLRRAGGIRRRRSSPSAYRRAATACCRPSRRRRRSLARPVPISRPTTNAAGRPPLITNRAHGALGYSLPAAIGACFGRPAQPGRGHGRWQLRLLLGELETLVRREVPLLMIVFSNAVYGWIKASQKAATASATFRWISRARPARIAERSAYALGGSTIRPTSTALRARSRTTAPRWSISTPSAAGGGGAGQPVDGLTACAKTAVPAQTGRARMAPRHWSSSRCCRARPRRPDHDPHRSLAGPRWHSSLALGWPSRRRRRPTKPPTPGVIEPVHARGNVGPTPPRWRASGWTAPRRPSNVLTRRAAPWCSAGRSPRARLPPRARRRHRRRPAPFASATGTRSSPCVAALPWCGRRTSSGATADQPLRRRRVRADEAGRRLKDRQGDAHSRARRLPGTCDRGFRPGLSGAVTLVSPDGWRVSTHAVTAVRAADRAVPQPRRPRLDTV